MTTQCMESWTYEFNGDVFGCASDGPPLDLNTRQVTLKGSQTMLVRGRTVVKPPDARWPADESPAEWWSLITAAESARNRRLQSLLPAWMND